MRPRSAAKITAKDTERSTRRTLSKRVNHWRPGELDDPAAVVFDSDDDSTPPVCSNESKRSLKMIADDENARWFALRVEIGKIVS